MKLYSLHSVNLNNTSYCYLVFIVHHKNNEMFCFAYIHTAQKKQLHSKMIKLSTKFQLVEASTVESLNHNTALAKNPANINRLIR